MKALLTLTAAALTTAALSLPAAASTIGCDQGDANASLNLRQCGVFNHAAAMPYQAPEARVLAPSYRMTVRHNGWLAPRDDAGVNGGAAG
jgi:hypothetical protein